MPLRFIHTADIHLGAKFLNLGEQADCQRENLKKVFTKIIDLAVEKKVDCVLIAGDLFDNANPSESLINFARNQFRKLQQNDIWLIAIPGTHDRLADGSVYKGVNFSTIGNKICIFNNPEKNSREIAELDAAFYANTNFHSKSHQSPLKNFTKLSGVKYHIALAHGSYQISGKSSEDDYPITENDIKNSEMDYIALGHWHGFLDVSQGDVKAFYSGSPELIALDQKNFGNILFIELKDERCEIRKFNISNTRLSEISIDLSKIHSTDDLTARISENENPDLIQKVILMGFRPESLVYDIANLHDELGDRFFSLIIEDNSIIDLGKLESGDYPQDYVLGKFIQRVNKSDLADKQKSEVLKYGIALLKGKNIL